MPEDTFTVGESVLTRDQFDALNTMLASEGWGVWTGILKSVQILEVERTYGSVPNPETPAQYSRAHGAFLCIVDQFQIVDDAKEQWRTMLEGEKRTNKA